MIIRDGAAWKEILAWAQPLYYNDVPTRIAALRAFNVVSHESDIVEFTAADVDRAKETLRKHYAEAVRDEMSETEWDQFRLLRHFDAASSRAMALWLDSKRKNRRLMDAVSAEMGFSARAMGRATRYFKPYFVDETVYRDTTDDQYQCLYEYAKKNRRVATANFAKYKFTLLAYVLREQLKADHETKPSLARRIATYIAADASDLQIAEFVRKQSEVSNLLKRIEHKKMENKP